MALNLSGPPAPPAAKTTRKAKTPPPPPVDPDAKLSAREDAVNGIFQLGGVASLMFGNLADASAFQTHGPGISKEIVQLGESNEQVGNFLDKLAAIGPYGGIVMAVLPFALQLMVNHGRIPAGPMLASMGIKDPKILESEVRREAIRQKMEYDRAVAEAEAEEAKWAAEEIAAMQGGLREPAAN